MRILPCCLTSSVRLCIGSSIGGRHERLVSTHRRTGRIVSAALAAAVCITLAASAEGLADVIPTGQVTDETGTINWDWVTPATTPGYSDYVAVGHTGTGGLTLNNQLGVTSIQCYDMYVGYDVGAHGTLVQSGNGASLYFANNMLIARGESSTGSFDMNGGATTVFPNYANHHVYVGYGENSVGEMTVEDPGTRLRLSDHIYVGLNSGSQGELMVKEGGRVETTNQYLGYYAGSHGKVTVDGVDSVFMTWRDDTYVGYSGTGELIVRNGASAGTDWTAMLGFANGSHGTATIDGAGSQWLIHRHHLFVGRGNDSGDPGNPGVGRVNLDRGGYVHVADVNANAYVGHSSYAPEGTLSFTFGDDGTGTIACGLLEVADSLILHDEHAYLELHVDPGTPLSLGTQFTLVDYGLLGSGVMYKRFNGIDDGDTYTTPNGYAFEIDYDTDLGGGDYALTATVTAVPEPGTLAMLALGALGMLACLQRRRRYAAGSLSPKTFPTVTSAGAEAG